MSPASFCSDRCSCALVSVRRVSAAAFVGATPMVRRPIACAADTTASMLVVLPAPATPSSTTNWSPRAACSTACRCSGAKANSARPSARSRNSIRAMARSAAAGVSSPCPWPSRAATNMARSVRMALSVENTASPDGATPIALAAALSMAWRTSASTSATRMPRTAAASAMAVRTCRIVATNVRSNSAARAASAGCPSGTGVCGATARIPSITPSGVRPSLSRSPRWRMASAAASSISSLARRLLRAEACIASRLACVAPRASRGAAFSCSGVPPSGAVCSAATWVRARSAAVPRSPATTSARRWLHALSSSSGAPASFHRPRPVSCTAKPSRCMRSAIPAATRACK